jgi:hypothetical protein
MPGFQAEAESEYLRRVSELLHAVLGRRLVGVYAGGSYALGDYLPGRSDLDIGVVVRSPLLPKAADAIVAQLRHDSLPCPARCLELVVYLEETTRSGSPAPDFELNLNTGRAIRLSVQLQSDAGDVGSHWFAIDRSILSQAGVALLGPPADEVFASIPPRELLPTLVESVRWHLEHEDNTSDAVLNACRSLRYAEEGLWSSKPAAGQWAAERGLAPDDLVSRALEARAAGSDLETADAVGFLSEAEARLRRGRT